MASTPLDPIAKTANLVTTEGKHNLRRSRSQFTVENPWKRRLDDDDLPSVANKGNVSSGRDQAAINRRHAAAKKEAISDLKTSWKVTGLIHGSLVDHLQVFYYI
jgi:hypothetical protein